MNTKLIQRVLLSTSLPRTRVIYKSSLLVAPIKTTKPRLFTTSLRWRSNMKNDKTCWQCQSTNRPSALFCENKVCSVIQPIPAHLNFFHLLQAGTGENKDQPTFDIDLKALKRQFLILQQKAHPDSFSQAPKREHAYAQLQSSVINKAYNILKNPLSRAQYLLEQQGIRVNESDSLSDPELLMDVMEFREELEEVQSEDELGPLKKRNDDKFQETVNNLSKAFKEKDYNRAKELTIELQYWQSIQSAIHEWHP
ncbi:Co-chaperone HscB, C-terminal oligomerization domain-containing protein [Pilaira anomala]|nr:Co-chaperone HscB, C-terminal oligomerization domain-containing protein [Pilaira anomala]